jgi:hypothetical protein
MSTKNPSLSDWVPEKIDFSEVFARVLGIPTADAPYSSDGLGINDSIMNPRKLWHMILYADRSIWDSNANHDNTDNISKLSSELLEELYPYFQNIFFVPGSIDNKDIQYLRDFVIQRLRGSRIKEINSSVQSTAKVSK